MTPSKLSILLGILILLALPAIPAVAAELGKTVGAVYIARSRVMQRLRDKVTEYETETNDPTVI